MPEQFPVLLEKENAFGCNPYCWDSQPLLTVYGFPEHPMLCKAPHGIAVSEQDLYSDPQTTSVYNTINFTSSDEMVQYIVQSRKVWQKNIPNFLFLIFSYYFFN
jgi:hypothetical protein